MMRTSYPWQVNSVIHKTKTGTKTLGIDAKLFSPQKEGELRTPSAPLEMHEGYSLFKGTLIVKDNEKKKEVLTFNLPAKVIPYIHKKTELLIEQNLFSMGSSAPKRKAYSVPIRSGKLKDKTPAQVLLENPRQLTELMNQKKWLESNLSKYPGNKEQIDAIAEAIKLYEEGALEAAGEDAGAGAGVYTVYETAPKNIQPRDEEGRWTIYQCSIKYIPKNNLPFVIQVMNCMAPVDTKSGNEIVLTKAINKHEQKMQLSEEEWFTMIDNMKAMKIMFENLTYPKQLDLAKELSLESYHASKKDS